MEQLAGSLQENILCVLAYDDVHGKALSRMVDTALFEGDYRLVAERLVRFWRDCGEAPKAAHTPDQFEDILGDRASRRATTIKRILTQMHQLWELGVNSAYVVRQYGTHVRVMMMQDGIIKAAEKLQAKKELAIEETEEILNNLLKARQVSFEPGTQLTDIDGLLDYMENKYSEFTTGITQLDKRNIVPFRSALMMLVGSAKAGKSWWLVHLGKQAFLQRKKIVHLSLEMSEMEIMQRYFQSLWSISKYAAKQLIEVPHLRIKKDKIVDIDTRTVRAAFSFNDNEPDVRMELETRASRWESGLEKIYVKRFPPRSLTPNGIRAYLDNLEALYNFTPDILLVDYAGLMKTDTRLHRVETGRNVEELRAIAVERNIAVCSAWQSNRAGAMAGMVKATHVSEDWSVVQTADTVLTFSRTDEEKQLGLGRLYVNMARGEEDGWGIVVTQGLELGQFVLESGKLDQEYWNLIGEEDEEDNGDDDKDED